MIKHVCIMTVSHLSVIKPVLHLHNELPIKILSLKQQFTSVTLFDYRTVHVYIILNEYYLVNILSRIKIFLISCHISDITITILHYQVYKILDFFFYKPSKFNRLIKKQCV